MAHVTERDFKKLADAVADDLVQQRIPLNDSITKLANSMGLNHSQVHRLCEATNNVAFNKMFSAKDKTASDRMVEFDIADPKQVIGSAIKVASVMVTTNTEAYELRPLRDEMHDVRHSEAHAPMTKVAFELRPAVKPSQEVDRRTLQKVLKNMQSQKLAAALDYRGNLYTLNDRFRRIYDVVPFAQFEKNAAALYGTDADEPLNTLRAMLRKSPVTYDHSLLEKQAGVVDDTTVEMKLLQAAMKAASAYTKLAASAVKIESML